MRRCAYLVSGHDGTRSRCPRMTRFEVLDDGVWAPRCDLHRRFDPGAETRAAGSAADSAAHKKSRSRAT
jgi:hypothetical protein